VLVASLSPFLEFDELDHAALIGVDQPLHFTRRRRDLSLQAHPFAFVTAVDSRVAAAGLKMMAQKIRIRQQGADVVPNLLLDPRHRQAAPVASPCRGAGIPSRADVPATHCRPSADQPAATVPADQ